MVYKFLNDYDGPLLNDTFLSDRIKKFFAYANFYYQNKLDKRTIYLMVRHIEAFEKFMYYQFPQIQDIQSITETQISDFRDFCSNGLKNDKKTVNSKLTSLKYFFKYLTEEGLIKYNIVLNITKLKNPQSKKPTFFKSSDLKVLFSEMRTFQYGVRDIVISKIVLTTGLEIQEILNLKLSNIDIENKNIIIKDKVYPIGDNLMMDFKDYLNIRKDLNINNSNFLFLSKVGTVYSARSYQTLFKRAITNTNIPTHFTPRYLRSTFLYNMARVTREEDLRVIAEQNQLHHYYELLKNPLQNLI